MLVCSLHTLTTCLMWKSMFILLLILGTAATPYRNGKQCFTIRKNHEERKLRLPECESGIFVRDSLKRKTRLCCYQEPAQMEYSRWDIAFNCTDIRSLKDFTVNGVQYVVITDNGRGAVTLLRWDEDDRQFQMEQVLYVDSPKISEVVHHRGQLLLLVGISNGQECEQCNNVTLSPVYQWNHVTGMFTASPIQHLPSTKHMRWFQDRYDGESTAFLVIGRCDCDTMLYSWNRHDNQFQIINQPMFERVPSKSDITIQTVRHQGTQYILLAQLKKPKPNIRVFNWTESRGMYLQGHLDVTLHTLSVSQYKGQVFMCTITKGRYHRGLTTISKLHFGSDSVTMTEVGRTEDPYYTQSFCQFHLQELELYVAVGYWNRPTSLLMRYSPITDSFSAAGQLSQVTRELSQNIGERDMVTFQNKDDFIIVTVANQRIYVSKEQEDVGFRLNMYVADL